MISSTIVRNGFHISFTNNGFQQLTSIDLLHPTNPLHKRNLMSRSYDPITQRLLSQTYGNGHTVSYDVDDLNRVIAIRHQGVVKTTFDYDANGLLGRLVEVDRGVTTRYIYDFANRLVSMVSTDGVSTRYHYDANNQVSSITDSVGLNNRTTSYTFDDDNRLTQLTTPANRIRSYTLDGLGRLTSSTINTTTPLLSSYTYQPHPSDPTLTSARLASVTHGSLPSIHYTYDANGNIVSVQQGSATIQYIYNELNEVIRENNQRDQVTWVYEYDLGGNIVAKKEYPYTTGSLSTPLRVIPYVYGDAVWKDLLTSYDGQAISSDTIGNPLIIGNRTFTWQKGRQLAALNIGGTNVQYSYNHAGIRTSKLVNGVTTTYRLRGDVVLEETTGSSTMRYGYDPNNQLISIEYGGVEYGVLRNAQNDVMALVNPSGSIVVQYAYSTWGEVVSISGSMASTLGAANPYRYRGYRFDTESGYYYLQSRYYDPQIGRFINADGLVSTGQGFNGYNMFAYSLNNPVNLMDPTGEIAITTAILIISIAAGVLAASYTAYESHKRTGEVDWWNSALAGVSTSLFVYTLGMSCYAIYEATSIYNGIAPRTEVGSSSSAVEPSRSIPHGNSHASNKQQHGYEIYKIKTGEVAKVGISGQPLNKNGSSPRANIQVNFHNRREGSTIYAARVIEPNLPNRQAAIQWEVDYSRLMQNLNEPMNLHIRP